MEGQVAKLEAQMSHVEGDVSEIKKLMHLNAEQMHELTTTVGTLAHMYEEMAKLRARQHSLSSSIQGVQMAQTLAKRCEERLDIMEKDTELNDRMTNRKRDIAKLHDTMISNAVDTQKSISAINEQLPLLNKSSNILERILIGVLVLAVGILYKGSA